MQRSKLAHSLVMAVLVLVSSIVAAAVETDDPPIMVLNTGGHTASVWHLLFTPDGKTLVSAGDGSAVRLWDVDTGGEIGVLRGEIAHSSTQSIGAIALASDGNTLAVAGFGASEDLGIVTLFDLATGEVKANLEGHSGDVSQLVFGRSTSTLSSASENLALIWNYESRTSLQSLDVSDWWGCSITPDGTQFAQPVSEPNRVVIHDLVADSDRTITLPRFVGDLASVVFDPLGRFLVQLDVNGAFHMIDAETGEWIRLLGYDARDITSLAISPDGQFLAIGVFGNEPESQRVVLWPVPDGQAGAVVEGPMHGEPTAIAFSPDGALIASAGSDSNSIYIWDVETQSTQHQMSSVGHGVWNVGWSSSSDAVAMSHEWNQSELTGSGDLSRSFHFSQLYLDHLPTGSDTEGVSTDSVQEDEVPSAYVGATLEFNGLELKIREPATGLYKDDELVTRLHIGRWLDDETIASAGLSPAQVDLLEDYIDPYELIAGATFTPAGDLALTFDHDVVLVDAETGDLLVRYVGHDSRAWAVAASPDGRFLASGSDDQTVRIWSLEDRVTQVQRPLMTLFVGENDEWVCATEDGQYAASANGDRLVGWHVNQGVDKAAFFADASQYRDTFYRPDVISRILEVGSVGAAREDADAAKLDVGVREGPRDVGDLSAYLPPVVVFVDPFNRTSETEEPTLTVRAVVRPVGNLPIDRIRILLNGRTVKAIKGAAREDGAIIEYPIDLEEGQNNIQIIAANAFVASRPESRMVTYRPTAPVERVKPDLYVLAIGVADYLDGAYDLQYPDDDARDFARICEEQEGAFYGKVETRVLTDEEATRDTILDSLDWLITEPKPSDVVFFFAAAHGKKDKRGDVYLLSHDADTARLRSSAVSWVELHRALSGQPFRTLLVMDTCYSGGFAGGSGQAYRRDATQDFSSAYREFASAESGMIVWASSTAGEQSQERDEWQNGAFTEALLAGIGVRESDFNHDGSLSERELALWLAERVKTMTGGQQHFVNLRPPTITEFPLFVGSDEEESAEDKPPDSDASSDGRDPLELNALE
jgi:WD40 repeat protein